MTTGRATWAARFAFQSTHPIKLCLNNHISWQKADITPVLTAQISSDTSPCQDVSCSASSIFVPLVKQETSERKCLKGKLWQWKWNSDRSVSVSDGSVKWGWEEQFLASWIDEKDWIWRTLWVQCSILLTSDKTMTNRKATHSLSIGRLRLILLASATIWTAGLGHCWRGLENKRPDLAVDLTDSMDVRCMTFVPLLCRAAWERLHTGPRPGKLRSLNLWICQL